MSKKFPFTRSMVEERSVFSGGSVDRSDPNRPKIVGALLNGNVSANNFIGEGKHRQTVAGRRYLAEAFANGRVQLYNGKPIFLNHPAKPTDSRDYRDKIAVVENARTRADGMPIGDLVVNPKNPYAEQFLWDAEHSPNSCGMSHRALFKWRAGSDQFAEAVELEEVLSVDVVVEPATTRGVFEHKERAMATIATVQEWLAKSPKSTATQCLRLKRLLEIGDYGKVAVAEMDDSSDAGSGVSDAVRAAAGSEIEECMSAIEGGGADAKELIKKCLKRLKKILHLHGDLNEPEEEESEGEPKGAEKMAESKIGYEKAVSLCTEAKWNATPRQVQLVAMFPAEVDAKAFIAEEQTRAQEVKPRSTGRTVVNPPKEVVEEQRAIPAWNRVASKN